MGRWIPDATLDLVLAQIALADEEAICSAQPTTYFNACWPNLWLPSTLTAVGALVHPPTASGFIYECTVGGTSGAIEPGWGTAQDQTFSDGTVTWKTHRNYALANCPLTPADFTIANGAVDGRKITVAQKIGVVTHTAGDVTHTALLSNAVKTLRFVTTSQTTLSGDDHVDSGRTTIFFAFDITLRDPQ